MKEQITGLFVSIGVISFLCLTEIIGALIVGGIV
jgi:hypothetical protein